MSELNKKQKENNKLKTIIKQLNECPNIKNEIG